MNKITELTSFSNSHYIREMVEPFSWWQCQRSKWWTVMFKSQSNWLRV